MDGTLIVLKPLIRDPKDIEFIEPTLTWVRKQQDLGYKILVATNQGEIALGYYTEEEFRYFMDATLLMLDNYGIHIDRVYYCPHHPEGIIPEYTKDCDCRKPKPGMLLQAIRDYNIDMSRSYFVGDKQTDIDAGQATGIQTKWVYEIWEK